MRRGQVVQPPLLRVPVHLAQMCRQEFGEERVITIGGRLHAGPAQQQMLLLRLGNQHFAAALFAQRIGSGHGDLVEDGGAQHEGIKRLAGWGQHFLDEIFAQLVGDTAGQLGARRIAVPAGEVLLGQELMRDVQTERPAPSFSTRRASAWRPAARARSGKARIASLGNRRNSSSPMVVTWP